MGGVALPHRKAPVRATYLICWSAAAALSTSSMAAGADLRLVEAVKARNAAAARALVAAHVDVNTPQPDGATALHWAAHWDDADTAALLIRAGANVNAADDYGVTPLALAAENGGRAVVAALVDRGARINVKNRRLWTPLVIAEGIVQGGGVKCFPKTAELLRKLGAEPSLPNIDRASGGLVPAAAR